jgi:energy-coupling factor transport system substrate-specific component
MFVSAWVGFSAGWLPHPQNPRLELALLVAFGTSWGLLYGALANLYFWPFFIGEVGMRYQPGSGPALALRHYAAFYVASSLLWDLVRAGGTGLLMLAAGQPTVRALSRFRDRFQFALAEAPGA